jgi:hypothetical protein
MEKVEMKKAKKGEAEMAKTNGSMPTERVAVESKPEQLTAKRYTVPITTDVQMTLKGDVTVYAACEAEAITKVQAQIDRDTVDDDLAMEDPYSGWVMPYGVAKCCDATFFEVVECDISVDDLHGFDRDDVLRAEVDELEAHVEWSAETLTKQKAFLERLLDSQTKAA